MCPLVVLFISFCTAFKPEGVGPKPDAKAAFPKRRRIRVRNRNKLRRYRAIRKQEKEEALKSDIYIFGSKIRKLQGITSGDRRTRQYSEEGVDWAC